MKLKYCIKKKRIPTNKCRRNKENSKSLLEHQSNNNYYRKDPLLDAEISKQSLRRYCTVSK